MPNADGSLSLPDPGSEHNPNGDTSNSSAASNRTGNEPSYDPTLDVENLLGLTQAKEWVPEEALANFVDERSVHKDETNKETARRLINENIPLVTQSMVHLALHSKSERTRLDAGKYLMDRSLGKPGENLGEASPLEHFFGEISDYVAAHPSGHNSQDGDNNGS